MNTEQERAELLPCPFCGEGKDLIVQHCEGTIIHPAYRIYCGNCGASNGYSDRVDPVKNWNSRAALQSQDREDALRYRYLITKLQQVYDGDYFETDLMSLYCHMPSQYKGERTVRAEITWRDKTDEPIGLNEAIDHARRIEENK